METQESMQQLRTPMDPLVSLASSFFSAFSPLLSPSAQQQQQGSTFLLLPLPVAAARALTVLRRLLLLATQAFISLFFMLLSALAPAPPSALAPTPAPACRWKSCLIGPCAVFLFKHANSGDFEQSTGGKEDKGAAAEQLMAMLRSWLPLLCRGSTGTDAPVLTGRERTEMVVVLEDLIDKTSWEQGEEVLSLWLHHFAACPDTDWPNLESCYTRWYAESRRLLA